MASNKSTTDGQTTAELIVEMTRVRVLVVAQLEEIARAKTQIEQDSWMSEEKTKLYKNMVQPSLNETKGLGDRLVELERKYTFETGEEKASKDAEHG